MEPKVAIIILNWNGWEDTIECIESVLQIDYPNYNVIVIDNNSNDDSIKKIEEYSEGKIKIKSKLIHYNPKNKPINITKYNEKDLSKLTKDNNDILHEELKIIQNNENYGFAEGNNIGIKFALKFINSDYILLLNNDTVVDKKFLNNLVEVAEIEDCGILGSKTFIYDHPDIIQFAGNKINLWTGECDMLGWSEIDHGIYNTVEESDYISGSCFLIKKETIEKIGFLDKNYFCYWEDADYCIRAKKAGIKSKYSPNSYIWHKVSASTNRISGLDIYLLNRNRIIFMKKNSNKLQYISFLLYLIFYKFWFMNSYLIYKKETKLIHCYLKGLRDGLKF